MQAIVIPHLRWTFVLSLTGFFLPATSLGAQQLERYAIPDDEVAIYNLAGQVRLEAGTGSDVTVQVTRGCGPAKVKVDRASAMTWRPYGSSTRRPILTAVPTLRPPSSGKGRRHLGLMTRCAGQTVRAKSHHCRCGGGLDAGPICESRYRREGSFGDWPWESSVNNAW